MTQPMTVLDYASPGSNRGLRLPARSILSYQRTPDGGVIVLETLRGKVEAIFAIVFAGFALATLTVVPADPRTPLPFSILSIALIIAGAITMFAVINRTWRRTILRAATTGVELSFISPLWPARVLQWSPERVLEAAATYTEAARSPNDPPAGELTLVIAEGPLIRLFTGHPHDELAWLGECIQLVIASTGMVECTNAANHHSATEDS